MQLNLSTFILASFGLFVLQRILAVLRASRAKGPSLFPKVYTPFYPVSLLGVILPTTAFTTGLDWHWVRRSKIYTRNETVNVFPILGGAPGLWTSNMDVGRQIAAGGQRSDFAKPDSATTFLLAWGMNLLAANGQMWRKYRRIVGPAFNVDLSTSRLYHEMVEEEGWKNKDVVDIPVIQSITSKFAFLVISACGFGFPTSWAAGSEDADGGMIQRTKLAFDRLFQFMHEQVAERKAEVASGAGDVRKDAFTTMVRSNVNEDAKYRLDDQELIGNIFILMLAGHDSTTHALAAALCFMAAHPNIQDEVVEQINSVAGLDRELASFVSFANEFDDYSKLDKVLAIFYEAARMFPAAHVMIREATEDTVLTIPNPVGQEGSQTIPIAKGTAVTVDMVGVQYNPRYLEDPHLYKPSRWYGLPTDSESFMAFSVGSRACIGRRFATVEATCLLANMLRDWRVQPLLREGDTAANWEARIGGKMAVTLGITDMPIQLRPSATRVFFKSGRGTSGSGHGRGLLGGYEIGAGGGSGFVLIVLRRGIPLGLTRGLRAVVAARARLCGGTMGGMFSESWMSVASPLWITAKDFAGNTVGEGIDAVREKGIQTICRVRDGGGCNDSENDTGLEVESARLKTGSRPPKRRIARRENEPNEPMIAHVDAGEWYPKGTAPVHDESSP
ncbi:cytochrome P450 [Roridomyces roridus]|uniref:Cytochrome P450 n=1 Tax=Roridomyces roridus TaxID=1738132 RepID=A0AAD7FP00_9AGAR|nr:cytochrome P450 [Roridomyces roridus]